MLKDKKILITYIFFGLFLTVFILGLKNISFTDNNWLSSIDMTQDLVSWYYFKNDVWRFPVGMNPNYGIDVGNSIVFTGAVPILAIVFKIFKFILPQDFHFFNIWYFLCFFLQSFVSFCIVKYFTKNSTYAFIASLFFLTSPVFITKLVTHMSLAAHWIILLSFFIEIVIKKKNKLIYWTLLITLSSLIHFSLTIIISIIFIIFSLDRLIVSKNIKYFFYEIFFSFSIVIFIMYVFGYFEIPVIDSLGYGYGYYKLNLASIINPQVFVPKGSFLWSNFLPPILVHAGESLEGFNYLGLGGILLLFILIFLVIFNYKKIIKTKLRPYLLISILFTIIALTNNISFSNISLIELELPKYIYGPLSLVRASGRLFWPVYYLIFIASIFVIYRRFSEKISISILSLLFFIQIIDISMGLKNIYNGNIFLEDPKKNDIFFWKRLDNQFDVLRSVHFNNNSFLLYKFRNVIINQNFQKTDLIRLARYNRKAASESRSNLVSLFNNKSFDNRTIYVIENENHLRNIKFLYKNKDVGFFFVNNTWVMVPGLKNEMSEKDIEKFENIGFSKLNLNEKKILNFKDNNSVFGLGWSHNMGSDGIWSEGNMSTILFNFNNYNKKKYIVKIKVRSISTKKNESLNFQIFFNNKIKKRYSLKNIDELNNHLITFEVNEGKLSNGNHLINFLINNPISPLEKYQSPDGRKLGILLESIELAEII